jgi:hypothetical protein
MGVEGKGLSERRQEVIDRQRAEIEALREFAVRDSSHVPRTSAGRQRPHADRPWMDAQLDLLHADAANDTSRRHAVRIRLRRRDRPAPAPARAGAVLGQRPAPGRAAGLAEPRARHDRRPAGRPLHAQLLDRPAGRPRDRPEHRADARAVLRDAAEGLRLQQQRLAHLRAVPHRRPVVQARSQDGGAGPAQPDELRHPAHRASRPAWPSASAPSINAVQNGGEIRASSPRRAARAARRSRASCASARTWPTASRAWTSTGTAAASRRASAATRSRCIRASRCWPRWWTCSTPAPARRPRARKWRAAAAAGSTRASPTPSPCSRATPEFWRQLASDDLEQRVLEMEPAQQLQPVDDDYLDDIALAFGQIVDAKSPFTAGHSSRVALITDQVSETAGTRRRRAPLAAPRRAAARRRQAGREQPDPRQARQARPAGMGRGAAPRAAHGADPRTHQRVRRARARRGRAPREAGRHRLPARPRRPPHPPRDAHHHDRRHLRRAHRRPPLPRRDAHGAGAAGDARRRRHARSTPSALLRGARALAGHAGRVQRRPHRARSAASDLPRRAQMRVA